MSTGNKNSIITLEKVGCSSLDSARSNSQNRWEPRPLETVLKVPVIKLLSNLGELEKKVYVCVVEGGYLCGCLCVYVLVSVCLYVCVSVSVFRVSVSVSVCIFVDKTMFFNTVY